MYALTNPPPIPPYKGPSRTKDTFLDPLPSFFNLHELSKPVPRFHYIKQLVTKTVSFFFFQMDGCTKTYSKEFCSIIACNLERTQEVKRRSC